MVSQAAEQNLAKAHIIWASVIPMARAWQKDAAEAVKWCTKPPSRMSFRLNQLGVCYWRAKGAEGFLQAYKWLNLASARVTKLPRNAFLSSNRG